VLAAALAALVTAALAGGFTDRQSGRQTGALPGLTGFLAVLLAVQAALLIVLAVSVVVLARRARAASRGPAASPGPAAYVPPYLGGNLAALIALLGLVLGGLLTAVINIGVTRLLGAPVPSGFQFDIRRRMRWLCHGRSTRSPPHPSGCCSAPWRRPSRCG
jgi:hypothetical protein